MITLHRLIVVVSGQPDAWATPMNTAAGRVDVDTRESWKGCSGGCQQGRALCDCSELANATPLRLRSVVLVRPAITVHRIPFTRRVRRFVRALLSHLSAARFL